MTYASRITAAKSLAELLGLLNSATAEQWEEIHAFPHLMTSLPIFGGDQPSDAMGVWSWDVDNLLVGEGSGFEIVSREEWADRAA